MSAPRRWRWVSPRLGDPRVTLLAALTAYTVLGQEVFYFNRTPSQIAASIGVCCLLDLAIAALRERKLELPLSGAITGLSLGLLLESYRLDVFVVAAVWAIASKHLLRTRDGHLFNPSNFGIVTALWLGHGIATVAPGSQWGGDYLYSLLIMTLGLLMMARVKRLRLVLGWLAGYSLMGLLRMAVGQGGLVFVLGPMTGAEFTLFTFSMIPDPKTSPSGRRAQVVWGLVLAAVDGCLRLAEIRFSMFYALFALCALRPLFKALGRSRLPGAERPVAQPAP